MILLRAEEKAAGSQPTTAQKFISTATLEEDLWEIRKDSPVSVWTAWLRLLHGTHELHDTLLKRSLEAECDTHSGRSEEHHTWRTISEEATGSRRQVTRLRRQLSEVWCNEMLDSRPKLHGDAEAADMRSMTTTRTRQRTVRAKAHARAL